MHGESDNVGAGRGGQVEEGGSWTVTISRSHLALSLRSSGLQKPTCWGMRNWWHINNMKCMSPHWGERRRIHQEGEQSLMQEGRRAKLWDLARAYASNCFFVFIVGVTKCEWHKNDTIWGSVLICALHFEKHFLLELGREWGRLGDINFSTAEMIVATSWKSSDQVLLRLWFEKVYRSGP